MSNQDHPNNGHPNNEALIAFVEEPSSSEVATVSLHLAGCKDCRVRISKMATMLEKVSSIVPRMNNDIDEATAAKAQAYVDTRRKDINQINIEHLSAKEQKAALHYALHSVAMEKALAEQPATAQQEQVIEAPTKDKVQQPDLLSQLADFFTSLVQWHPPAWATVPITAGLVFGIVFMLQPTVQHKPGSDMVAAVYQDEPSIIFTQQGPGLPGIGFFEGGREKKESFGGFKVTTDEGNQLHLQWRPVKSAVKYSIRLYVLTGSERTVIGTQTSSTNNTTFLNYKVEPGRRYEWELTGETEDQLNFKAEGGFVMIRVDF